MIRLLLLLLVALSAYGQSMTITTLSSVSETAHQVHVELTASGVDSSITFLYGASGAVPALNHGARGNIGGEWSWNWTQLAASTRYVFFPRASIGGTPAAHSDAWVQSSLCPDGLGVQTSLGSLYECDSTGDGAFLPALTTAARPGDWGAVSETPRFTGTPVSESLLLSGRAVDGFDYPVNPSCTDLQARMTACAADAAVNGLVNTVTLPADIECRPELEGLTSYTGAAIAGGGRCVLRSACASRLLPPAAAPFGPGYGCSAVVRWNGRYKEATASRDLMTLEQGWDIEKGVEIRWPSSDEIIQQRYAITAFDVGTGVISCSTCDFLNGEKALIYLPGVIGPNAAEHCTVSSAVPGVSFICETTGLAGSYAGGGYATDSPIWDVASVDAAGAGTFASPAPFSQRTPINITSFSGSTLEFASSGALRRYFQVRVSGCDLATDGIYAVTGPGGPITTSVTVSPAAPVACSSGTVQELHLAELRFGRRSTVHLVDITGENGFQVVLPAWSRGAVSNGWASLDTPWLPASNGLVEMSGTTGALVRGVRFRKPLDASFIMPQRTLKLNTTQQAGLAGVVGEGVISMAKLNPQTGANGQITTGGGFPIASIVQVQGADSMWSRNTVCTASGWCHFADTANTTLQQTKAIRLDGGYGYMPPWFWSPDDGRAAARRQIDEFKQVWEIEIINRQYEGCAQANVDTPACVFLGPRPATFANGPYRHQDVLVRNVGCWAAECLTVDGDGGILAGVLERPARLLVDNSLLLSSQSHWTTGAGGTNLEAQSSFTKANGQAVRFNGGVTARIRRSTLITGGRGATAIWYPPRIAAWVRIEDSIIAGSYSAASGTWGTGGGWQSISVPGSSGTWNPPLLATSALRYALWKDRACGQGQIADCLGPNGWSVSNTRIVACAQNGEQADWYTRPTTGVVARLQADHDCSADSCVGYDVTIEGAEDTPCKTNLESTFSSSSFVPVSGSEGADLPAMRRAWDRYEPTATPIAGGVRVSFVAPKAEACQAQATTATKTGALHGQTIPDVRQMGEWVSSGAGPGNDARSIDLTGFPSGVVVWWRVVCGVFMALGRQEAL